jgi:hypothetical protein
LSKIRGIFGAIHSPNSGFLLGKLQLYLNLEIVLAVFPPARHCRGQRAVGDRMTIDERLERLTERHEALTRSAEMQEKRFEDIGEKIRTLAVIAEPNEVRAGEIQAGMTQMMDSITRLARIAGSHEERIGSLES